MLINELAAYRKCWSASWRVGIQVFPIDPKSRQRPRHRKHIFAFDVEACRVATWVKKTIIVVIRLSSALCREFARWTVRHYGMIGQAAPPPCSGVNRCHNQNSATLAAHVSSANQCLFGEQSREPFA